MAGLFWNSGSPYRALPRQTPSLGSEGQKRTHSPRTQTVFLVTKALVGASASLRGLAPAGPPGSHGGCQPERQLSGDMGASRGLSFAPSCAPAGDPHSARLPHPLRDLGGASRLVLCRALLAGISLWPQTEDIGGCQKPDEAGTVLLQSLRGEGGPVNTLISDSRPQNHKGIRFFCVQPPAWQTEREPETPTSGAYGLADPAQPMGTPAHITGPSDRTRSSQGGSAEGSGLAGHSAPAPGSSFACLPGFCSQDEVQLRGHETAFPVRSGSD